MRGIARTLLFMLAALWVSPVSAQPVVTSSGPQKSSVTLYRDPNRGQRAINRTWPTGVALVTETRTVDLPAGRAVIRFEGVASGILPESVVVSGLPADVREKNLDADLLSPFSLYDRSLGRSVLIRRTDAATGRERVEPAVIRSAGNGAAVLETASGIEALRCTGLAEGIVYPQVPAGLSPRPTLSIQTEAATASRVTLTLTYLASGFDWQANHVITLGEGGRAEWSARVTLVSRDATSFPDTGLQLVAGKVEREEGQRWLSFSPSTLGSRCWPRGSGRAPHHAYPVVVQGVATPPPAPPAPPAPMAARADIVVTGMRVALEQLGDLKLYRAPRPVTVAARAQKQIGLFERESVPLQPLYRSDISGTLAAPVRLVLKTRNREAEGLGLPIPAGPVAVIAGEGAHPVLIGEGRLADRAVGERVEIELEPPADIQVRLEPSPAKNDRLPQVLTVTNATPRAIDYEARISIDEGERLVRKRGLVREDGRWVWRKQVPANGKATFSWTVRPDRDAD